MGKFVQVLMPWKKGAKKRTPRPGKKQSDFSDLSSPSEPSLFRNIFGYLSEKDKPAPLGTMPPDKSLPHKSNKPALSPEFGTPAFSALFSK
ncbi:hypothetical protein BDV11DRAFT_185444 [Aspergillus similis]